MPTQLETLPNELLLGVFVYLDIVNLYNSFGELNQRLNNLVRTVKHFSYILTKNDPCVSAMFAPQISRLTVNTAQLIDFHRFCNLSSLELSQASKEQLEQIRSDIMPNLALLKITAPSHISLPSELIVEVFSNGFRFLRFAHLCRLDISENGSKLQSLSLRTLHITCTDTNTIPVVLQACPNLFSFQVKFFGEDRHIPPPPQSSSCNDVLEVFFLNDPYHKLSLDTVKALFLYMPNVTHLNLQLLCRAPFIELIESVLNSLKRIDHFECDIVECPNNNMVDIELIQQMNACFQCLDCIEKDNRYRIFYTE